MFEDITATMRGLLRRIIPGGKGRAQVSDPRHELGLQGERLAERFLQRQGYRRIARNERLPGGEIDLIMAAPRPDPTMVFVEVKTRRSDQVLGEFAINAAKRRRLIQLTQRIARRRGWSSRPLRIDVIVVVWADDGADEEEANGGAVIRHHPNAVTL